MTTTSDLLRQLTDSHPETVVLDAFGRILRKSDLVHWAGTDYKERPTLNEGLVVAFKPGYVKVHRLRRSTRNGLENTLEERRKVWVELWKVAKVNFP